MHQHSYVPVRQSSTYSPWSSKSSQVSSDSTISTTDMELLVERLAQQNHRPTTIKNYYSVWKSFNKFFIRLDNKPETWEDRLTLFVGYLVQNDTKSTTVKSYISAIRNVLRQDGIVLNENKYKLNALMKACRYINDSIRIRFPIKKGLLNLILDEAEHVFDQQPYLKLLYQSILATAFYGLFRIGELTEGPHVIKARDVHVAMNKNKMMFVLRTSKTHWFDSKPQIVKISSVMDNKLMKKQHNKDLKQERWCPFKLLQCYVKLRRAARNEKEQFYVFYDYSPIKPQDVRVTLRNLLQNIGLDPLLYNCGSLRIGRATQLVNDYQISVETVKKFGRWKSNAVFTYLR